MAGREHFLRENTAYAAPQVRPFRDPELEKFHEEPLPSPRVRARVFDLVGSSANAGSCDERDEHVSEKRRGEGD